MVSMEDVYDMVSDMYMSSNREEEEDVLILWVLLLRHVLCVSYHYPHRGG